MNRIKRVVIILFTVQNIGSQSTVFDSMSNIQVGGKIARNGRFRIERPFVGVISGLSVNRLRVLDLAAERDPHVTVRGDVQLVTGVLDRNDLQRMQQVRRFSESSNSFKTYFYIFRFFSHCCVPFNKYLNKEPQMNEKANEMVSFSGFLPVFTLIEPFYQT